jgi:hypothetical protein
LSPIIDIIPFLNFSEYIMIYDAMPPQTISNIT